MKKIILVILILFAVKLSYSDQLQWITKEQAEKTAAYFEDEGITQAVLWCACCEGDRKTKVYITSVTYIPASDPSYYEVHITGTTSDGIKINTGVDLAYVHIKRGGKWRCLGKELKFECDPCTKAFKF